MLSIVAAVNMNMNVVMLMLVMNMNMDMNMNMNTNADSMLRACDCTLVVCRQLPCVWKS